VSLWHPKRVLPAHADTHVDGGTDEIISKLDFRAMNIIASKKTYSISFSTSSTTLVDVTGVSTSITIPAGATANVLVICSNHSIYNDTTSAAVFTRLVGPATKRDKGVGVTNTVDERYCSEMSLLDIDVAAGTYTVKQQAAAGAGTIKIVAVHHIYAIAWVY